MAEERIDRFDLHFAEESIGLATMHACSKEEKEHFKQLLRAGVPLPSDVFYARSCDAKPGGDFLFYCCDSPLNAEEKAEYIALRQLETQKKIHFWVKFWSIAAICTFCAGCVAGLIILLAILIKTQRRAVCLEAAKPERAARHFLPPLRSS